MNKLLLHTKVQEFIKNNVKEDLTRLILKGSPFPEISIQEIAEQIQSKSKCAKKLPTWYQTDRIYYPKPLNIEQTSSEITASYKSSLVSGSSIIDLTGGFGVDCFYFSKTVEQVVHCEREKELSLIADYNFDILSAPNIRCKNEDGISLVSTSVSNYDWIYVDPSRRNTQKDRVFRLEDCLPDVSQHFETLVSKSSNIMLKLSPFLDISATVNSLNFIKEIHIVAVKNEVKELLFIVEKNFSGPIILKTINLLKNSRELFEGHFLSSANPTFSLPKKYLFEPNSAILKSGLFNEVSDKLKVDKLHNNSHLYTSDKCVDFPGRRFLIVSVNRYNKKLIKKVFDFKKANITTRNFKSSVAEIRKTTGFKEGGEDYLFFTTDVDNNAIVIHCKKM